MRHLGKRLFALFASILMVVSLLPSQFAFADTTGEIDYIEFGNSTSLTSPYQVNNGTINFSVSFSNINPTSLTYTVQQVTSSGSVTTTSSISGSVQPQNLQPQNSPTQATFTNVPLFEGLNMITVSGTLSSSTQSANTSSGMITRTAYVNYLNVPIISSVDVGSTSNLTSSNSIAYVTGTGPTGNTSFTVHSQNADQLTITNNGQPITPTPTINPIGSPVNEFIVTNVSLNPGENDFEFTATNSIRHTITSLTITVIYYNNQPVVYNVTGQFVPSSGSSYSSAINTGQPITISGTTTFQSITSGKVLIPNSTGVSINNPMTATLLDSSGSTLATYSLTPVSTSLGSTYPFLAYTISGGSTGPGTISSGTYTLQFNVTSGGTTNTFNLPFSVQDSSNLNTPTLYQLGNVSWSGNGTSGSTAASATKISGTINKQNGPVYIDLGFANSKTASLGTPSINNLPGTSIPALQVGPNIYVQLVDSSGQNYIDSTKAANAQTYLNWSLMSSEILTGGTDLTGTVGLQIDGIPSGSYTLNVYDSAQNNKLVQSATINNYNAPSIQLTNAYNGQIFSSQQQTIIVQANNFDNLQGDISLTLNGVSKTYTSKTTPTGSGPEYTFDSLQLTNGPNKLVFTANNGTTKIEADFTLYYYSNSMPVIGVQPSGISATLDSGLQTPVTNTGNNTYSTNGSTVKLQGTFKNAAKMTVQVNGQYEFGDTSSVNTIAISSSGISGRTDSNSTGQLSVYSVSAASSDNTYSGSFAVTQPIHNGQTAFTFTVLDNSGNQSQIVITITKGALPFTVVSPSIAMNGSYTTGQTISYGPYNTNQNFIDLIIQTSPADSVTIGKNTAAIIYQDTTNGIVKYGTEVQNLKPGTNTIPVQITSGTTKTKGSIIVNYLNQNVVGAQNRILMPTTGKVTAFGGLVQLQFPKNTVFQQQSDPGQQSSNPSFYANQTILFGIANKSTGEITTQPNTSTFYTGQSTSYSTLQSVIGSEIPLGYNDNYSFASNMFWIDAGDPNLKSDLDTSGNQFIPTGGLDPYYPYNLDATSYWNNAPTDLQDQSLDYRDRTSTSDWLQPTNPGTVTLQYDSNIRNIDTTSLTIMYLDHSGSWVKVGGTVNVSNHTITTPFQGFGYYVVTNVNSKYSDLNTFVDSGDQSWARTYLNIMLAKGMMVPENGTYFGVSDNITRGEFAEILVKALNVPLNYDSNASFDDVPYSESTVQNIGELWSFPYIETSARAGIVNGLSSRVFGPNLPLTREDAAVMIARAANFKMALDPNAAIAALQKAYTDASSINPYAAPGVLAVYKAKIMTGNPTTPGAKKTTYYFGPTNNLLRSEAAVIAVHLMQQQKLLPTSL